MSHARRASPKLIVHCCLFFTLNRLWPGHIDRKALETKKVESLIDYCVVVLPVLCSCLRAPGWGAPGFRAGSALVFCLLFLTMIQMSILVSRCHLRQGHRPNSCTIHHSFSLWTSLDLVTLTAWRWRQKKHDVSRSSQSSPL